METVKIGKNVIEIINKVIEIALLYENCFDGKRKLGITGEVGEILACQKLNLKLVLDTINKGFDAIDNDGKMVQIKCCRSETLEISPDHARVGKFSKHIFDYAILVLLGRKYNILEILKVDYSDLEPTLCRNDKRNPSIGNYRKIALRIYPK